MQKNYYKLLAELQNEVKTDFASFIAYMGYSLEPHILGWIEQLENPDNNFIVELSPRSHAKSTTYSINYPAWRIGNDPNIRILLISQAQNQAQGFLNQIRGYFESQAYQKLFGNLQTEAANWTQSTLTVARPNILLKDPTITAIGSGGALLSRRADLIIADDILNERNTRTPESRQRLKDWWNEVVMPILEPDGQVIVCGTPFNDHDLYAELMADFTIPCRHQSKAIIRWADWEEGWQHYEELWRTEGSKAADAFYNRYKDRLLEGTEVLWESRWSYKSLIDLRLRIGKPAFSLMYQTDTSEASNSPFGPYIEQSLDAARSLILTSNSYFDPLGELTIAQGVDLAATENGDETAVVTLGRTTDGVYVLLGIKAGRFTGGEIRQVIEDEITLFMPELTLVENNGFQQMLVKDIQSSLVGERVRGFTTTGEKFDLETGIYGMAVAFENGKFILPYSPDPHTQMEISHLIDDMHAFPLGHTGDRLMALWFAYTALRSIPNRFTGAITATDIRSPLF